MMIKLKNKMIPYPEEIGNKILYDMCSKFTSNTKAENVSAKSWLIGRSYAVSPQRRKNAKKFGTKYDYFFDNFGNEFASVEEAKEVDATITKLKNKKFKGDFIKDKEIILGALKLINLFNMTVKKVISKLDDCESEETFDYPSFSSKYLHFHCPKVVFIYDSYSNRESARIFKELKNSTDNNLLKQINELKTDVKSEGLNSNERFKAYINHYIRCYFISIYCGEKVLTPRQVDTALLQQLL